MDPLTIMVIVASIFKMAPDAYKAWNVWTEDKDEITQEDIDELLIKEDPSEFFEEN